MAYSLFALLGFFGTAHGWFLPGVAPHHFARGERVELKVNKLTSTQTQVNDNL
jgi:transmembrane 9 superfamily protein 2/4